MFACFRKPGGDDTPRGHYRRSASGGHPTSERSDRRPSTPRGRTVSEPPPPKDVRKLGPIRSAMAAAAGSSRSKLIDTFNRRRPGSTRYISMRVPSDTKLPSHVPRSLGRGDSNAASEMYGEDCLHLSSPQSMGNREFNSISSHYGSALLNSVDLANFPAAQAIPKPTSQSPRRVGNSMLSPQATQTRLASSTLPKPEQQVNVSPPSPSQISALHGSEAGCYPVLPCVEKPALRCTSLPHVAAPPQYSNLSLNKHPCSPRLKQITSHSSISIPLDSCSYPLISAPLGDTLHCASSVHSHSRDVLTSQDFNSQARPAVLSAATSTTSLAFRDSSVQVSRSSQSPHDSTPSGSSFRCRNPTRDSAATGEPGSSSQGAMPASTPTCSPDALAMSQGRCTCSVDPAAAGLTRPGDSDKDGSHGLGGELGGGSSVVSYFAPGFALLASSSHLPTKSYDPAEATQLSPDNSAAVACIDEGSTASDRRAPQPAVSGTQSPQQTLSATSWARPKHEPCTPPELLQATNSATSRVAVASGRTSDFATPMDPSRLPSISPEGSMQGGFSIPHAHVSPERMSILCQSMLPNTSRLQRGTESYVRPIDSPHDFTMLPQKPPVPAPAGRRSKTVAALPSPADLLKILPSTAKTAPATPVEAGSIPSPQPNSAAAGNGATQHNSVLAASPRMPAASPPLSLNMELSTPESRPVMTPGERHTFASHPSNAAFMGCVDNPVFSEGRRSGHAVTSEYDMSGSRSGPGSAKHTVNPAAHCDAVPISADTCKHRAGIAAAAKRVAAMCGRDSMDGSEQEKTVKHARTQRAHSGEEKRKKKKNRQVANDDAAELLFSTDLDSVTIESVTVDSQDLACNDSVDGACDDNVPSPPMPQTISTTGTVTKSQAEAPLPQLPDLSLQPSAAKHLEDKSSAPAVQASTVSSYDQSVTFSDCGRASKEGTQILSRNVSITAGLMGSTTNATDISGDGSSYFSQTGSADRLWTGAAAALQGFKGGKEGSGSKVPSRGNFLVATRRNNSSADTSATADSAVQSDKEQMRSHAISASQSSAAAVSSVAAPLPEQGTDQGCRRPSPASPTAGPGARPINPTTEADFYVPPDLPSLGNDLAASNSNATADLMFALGNPPKQDGPDFPQDLPSQVKADSSGVKSGSTGVDYSLSVRMTTASFHSTSSSKAAEEHDNTSVAQDGADRVPSIISSDPAVHTSVDVKKTLVVPRTAAESAPVRLPIAASKKKIQTTAASRLSPRSAGSGASETESQHLEVVMNTSQSGLELHFSATENEPDVPQSSKIGHQLPQKQPNLDGFDVKNLARHSTGRPGCVGAQPGAVIDHSKTSHEQAVARKPGACSQVAVVESSELSEATKLAHASDAGFSTYTPGDCFPGGSTYDEDLMPSPSPSPGQSPMPACASLPLANPDVQPQVGDILGGRFLLRRVVGSSSTAIIWAANDLQEGSVPCSVRVPAPKTPLAASMIALGRMQWLRERLSQAEGATSLVTILSMPKLLGHGIVVATESLEASISRRLDLISRGKAKAFSSSDLRSLARQLLKGLKFMHESGIVHGDINLESLFFKSEEGSQIRFVDLGYGCFPTGDKKPTVTTHSKTPMSMHNASSVGSFWNANSALSHRGRESVVPEASGELDTEATAALCRAPEAFMTPPIVSDKMDVWSVGCILYHIETGEPLGHEPQAESSWPNVLDPGPPSPHYFSETNSIWEEIQQTSSRGHQRCSLGPFGAIPTHISADVSEELLYDTLPGRTRTRRSTSPYRRKATTPDTAVPMHAALQNRVAADRLGVGGTTDGQPGALAGGGAYVSAPPSASSAAAARACAEMWDVDALVIVEDGVANFSGTHQPPTNSNYVGLNGAARQKDLHRGLHGGYDRQPKHRTGSHRHTSASEAERMVQMQACQNVLRDALSDQGHGPHDSTYSGVWTTTEASTWDDRSSNHVRPQSHLSFVQAHAAKQSSGNNRTVDTARRLTREDIEREFGARTYPSTNPQRQHNDFTSTGDLQPPHDFVSSASASKDTTKSDGLLSRRSLVNVVQSRWGGYRKASLSPPPRNPHDTALSSYSSNITEGNQRRSRDAQRRSGKRWGFRSLSGARKSSAGHSNSLPPPLQSFRSENVATPADDSFSKALQGIESTADLHLTISARESYTSLPSTQHTHTQRASLHSNSGRVPGVSGALSGALSGGLGSGVPSLPGSTRAAVSGGPSCRPWLAQRLSKIQDREFARFLSFLLESRFLSRPTAQQALQHPWLSFQGLR